MLEGERRRVFRPVLHCGQCCGGTLKLAFRLFPWRVGALNACGAFNFAAAPWKFARKLVARPTCSARHGWKVGTLRPYCFLDSGGLGLRTNAFAYSVALEQLIHTPIFDQ